MCFNILDDITWLVRFEIMRLPFNIIENLLHISAPTSNKAWLPFTLKTRF